MHNIGGYILHTTLLIIVRTGSIAIFDLQPIIFPDPLTTLHVFLNNTSTLASHALYTIGITTIGIVLTIIVSLLLGIFFYHRLHQSKVLFIYLTGLRSLPIVAIAPFLTVRIGTGSTSHIVLSFLAGFFPLLLNFLCGLQSADPDLLRYMQQRNTSGLLLRKTMLFPSALKHFFTGLKITVSLCLIGTIVGEFISSQQGLGYVIKSSMYYLDTALALCSLIFIFVIGALLFGCIEKIERTIIFR